MFIDILENFVSEEECIKEIAELIMDGKSDEELSAYYPAYLLERAHLYLLAVYF